MKKINVSETTAVLKSKARSINAQIHVVSLRKECIILFYWPENKADKFTAALNWAKENKLCETTKDDIVAVAEKVPNLHEKLNMSFSPMRLVETTGSLFKGDETAICIEWSEGKFVSRRTWRETIHTVPGYTIFAFKAA
jgi:hypothetical protein